MLTATPDALVVMKPFALEALKWYQGEPGNKPPKSLCASRDLFQARLDHFYQELSSEIAANELALMAAVTGEIGNNCFDHNLGQWRDDPGCWFEYSSGNGRFQIVIADRGQGVFASLKQVVSSLKNDQDALQMAFEKRVSGRHPENRGNGLKFVRSVVNGSPDRGLIFSSGKGRVVLGGLVKSAGKQFGRTIGRGTCAILLWRAPK